MALLGKFDETYTRTGNRFLTRMANRLSFIPGVGAAASFFLGLTDTTFESIGWLFKGKLLSAATVATVGTAGHVLNGISALMPDWWAANAASGVTTSTTLGTHVRKGGEVLIGSITGALGMKPTVLKSYTVGIGGISQASMPSGPGQFATAEAGRRGRDADEMYRHYANGEGRDTIAALEAARMQQSLNQGRA